MVLLYEHRGADTTLVCIELINFVNTENRWPKNWNELVASANQRQSFEKNVEVAFGIDLQGVAKLFQNGELVVFPKLRAFEVYQSRLDELERVVDLAAQRIAAGAKTEQDIQ